MLRPPNRTALLPATEATGGIATLRFLYTISFTVCQVLLAYWCHRLYLHYHHFPPKYPSASLIFSSRLRSEEAGRMATALVASAAE